MHHVTTKRGLFAAALLAAGLIAPVASVAAPVAAAPEIPENVPNAPRNVVADPTRGTADGTGDITVTWNAPIDGPAVDDYLVVVTELEPAFPPARTWECQRDAVSAGPFECEFEGLPERRPEYRVRVRSRNALGVTNAPAEKVALYVAPPSSSLTLAGDESIVVKWGAPTQKGFGHQTAFDYIVSLERLDADGDHDGSPIARCVTAQLECAFGDLTNGAEYRATLSSRNAAGTNEWAYIFATPTADAPSVLPVPDPPTDVGVEVGDRKLTVTWKAPTSGAAVVDYLVSVDEGTQSCTTAALRCVLTGLANGTDYRVRVAARNKGGSRSVTPGKFTPRPPGFAEKVSSPPTKVVVSPADKSVAVSWVAPKDPPGAEVDDYVVSVEPGGHSCTTATLTCVITGLTNGTEYTLRVRARNEAGLRSAPPQMFTPNELPPPVIALTPARIYESRVGPGFTTIDGLYQNKGPLLAKKRVVIEVFNRPGVPVGATAVVVNVTVVAPVNAGFITLFPCTAQAPTASTLNYAPGQVIANSTTIRMSATGTICAISSSKADLIIDLTGYVPAGSDLVTVKPSRLFETRSGEANVTVDGKQQNVGRLGAGDVVTVNVGGRGTLPVDMSAALLNVAVVGPSNAGFLTMYPCDQPRPTASTLNHAAGQTIANGVTVKLDPTGNVCIFSRSEADVIVDFLGYAPATSALATVTPARLYETRAGEITFDGRQQATGRRSSRQITRINVAGRAGVPNGAGAVIVNAAAIGPAGPGYLTLFPCDEDRPLASTLNYAIGQVVANGATVELDSRGDICAFTLGDTDLIVDVTGYLPS